MSDFYLGCWVGAILVAIAGFFTELLRNKLIEERASSCLYCCKGNGSEECKNCPGYEYYREEEENDE